MVTAHLSPSRPPPDLVTRIWQTLTRATVDRHHAWKTPVLASVGVDGHPQARTIVLRQAHPASWTLTAYTDRRTPKCQALIQHPRATLLFWSPKLRWQCRMLVDATVLIAGEAVETAWARMQQAPSAQDYLSPYPPGQAMEMAPAVTDPNTCKQHQLAVLQFQVVSMDWLALGQAQHLRASIDAQGNVTPCWP